MVDTEFILGITAGLGFVLLLIFFCFRCWHAIAKMAEENKEPVRQYFSKQMRQSFRRGTGHISRGAGTLRNSLRRGRRSPGATKAPIRGQRRQILTKVATVDQQIHRSDIHPYFFSSDKSEDKATPATAPVAASHTQPTKDLVVGPPTSKQPPNSQGNRQPKPLVSNTPAGQTNGSAEPPSYVVSVAPVSQRNRAPIPSTKDMSTDDNAQVPPDSKNSQPSTPGVRPDEKYPPPYDKALNYERPEDRNMAIAKVPPMYVSQKPQMSALPVETLEESGNDMPIRDKTFFVDTHQNRQSSISPEHPLPQKAGIFTIAGALPSSGQEKSVSPQERDNISYVKEAATAQSQPSANKKYNSPEVEDVEVVKMRPSLHEKNSQGTSAILQSQEHYPRHQVLNEQHQESQHEDYAKQKSLHPQYGEFAKLHGQYGHCEDKIYQQFGHQNYRSYDNDGDRSQDQYGYQDNRFYDNHADRSHDQYHHRPPDQYGHHSDRRQEVYSQPPYQPYSQHDHQPQSAGYDEREYYGDNQRRELPYQQQQRHDRRDEYYPPSSQEHQAAVLPGDRQDTEPYYKPRVYDPGHGRDRHHHGHDNLAFAGSPQRYAHSTQSYGFTGQSPRHEPHQPASEPHHRPHPQQQYPPNHPHQYPGNHPGYYDHHPSRDKSQKPPQHSASNMATMARYDMQQGAVTFPRTDTRYIPTDTYI